MTYLEDGQILVGDIEQACADGARLAPTYDLAGIDAGTLRCCKADDGLAQGDRQPDTNRPVPSPALSEIKQARIIEVVNEPCFVKTLFRTVKYRSKFPLKGLADLEAIENGARALYNDTTMNTTIAASATSPRCSVMLARMVPCSPTATWSTRTPSNATRSAEVGRRATGHRLALSLSIRSAMLSSERPPRNFCFPVRSAYLLSRPDLPAP
jgi:hypothetical protein